MRQELLPFISTIEVDSEFLMVLKIVRNKNCNDNGTGWRPVVAAYQWWPFAFCTRNYAFVAPQIPPFYKQ